MLTNNFPLSFAACTIALVLGATGCATPHAESLVEKRPLPSDPPKVHQLKFEPSPSGFPLRPPREERSTTARPELKFVPDIENEREARIWAAAEQNPLVAKELGKKFRRFEAEEMEVGRGICHPEEVNSAQETNGGAPQSITRLTYFSYSSNETVIVCMRDEKFLGVGRMEDYQPPESTEEIEEAVKLAGKDSRLVGKIESLQGHAILIEPESGWFFGMFSDLGAGNRVLWVTFSKRDRDPVYWAVVDMTKNEVLDAGQREEEQ